MKKNRVIACLAALAAAGALLAAPCQAAFAAPIKTVYRLYHPGTLDHHYTMDANEYRVLGSVGWQQEGVAWDSRDSSAVPVYRLYHEGTRDHHYTKDYNEYRVLGSVGWKQEGVAW